MPVIGQEELQEILRGHALWLSSDEQEGCRADLTGANLDGANLDDANLQGAIVTGAKLDGASLRGAHLIHANLSDAQMRGANLDRANLLLADFTGADLSDASLVDCTCDVTEGVGHVLQGPRFRNANLKEADLRRSALIRSDFTGAHLEGALFEAACLEGANLSNCDLTRLRFTDCDLRGVSFRSSNLSRVSFVDADAGAADFEESVMSQADVSGTNLQSASLEGAKVDGIIYDRRTRFRGIRVFSCYGSSRFRRFAQDQDYLEEFRAANPWIYNLWLLLTDCGRSIARVVFWSMVIIGVFSVTYFYLGEDSFMTNDGLPWSLFTTTYYSVVTFTTLGFGDITPATSTAAVIVMIEVIVGYVMLGILISILATKVARRS